MPFGSVFGLLHFGFLCVGVGIRLAIEPQARIRFAGTCLVLLGASLAAGLLRHSAWARWLGCGSAVVVGLFALELAGGPGSVVYFVLLLSSLVTAVLLVLPATGRPPAPRKEVPVLRWAALAGAVGLAATSLWAPAREAGVGSVAKRNGALPAAARAAKIEWTDHATGLERARTLERPMVVTFVTDWCPYCTKMNRDTWRSPEVAERLAELVSVKVDAEETQASNGPPGAELAARYGVRGFPANFLVGPDGGVIARQDGYLSARQFLDWLDGTLGPARGAAAAGRSGR